MAKISRLESKLNSCLEDGYFYEAHQIYRTLYYRLCSQEKWKELLNLLYEGALRLLEVNEVVSAIDLAELFVEVLVKFETCISSDVVSRLEQLFSRIPASLEEEDPSTNKVDKRSNFLSSALKWSMKVSDKKRYRAKGHPSLHRIFGMRLWQEGNYQAARNHLILCDDTEKFALFLIDFQQKCGFDSEKDLFIVQAVLQLLCQRRPKTAAVLLQQYCIEHPKISGEPPYQLPLLNFAWLLTLSVQTKKLEFFTILVERYEHSIKRDNEYRIYLDKIGQIYFGLPPPNKSTNSNGLLGNIFRGLIGANEAQSYETADDSEEEFFTSHLDDDFLTPSNSVNNSPATTSASYVNQSTSVADDAMDLD